MRIRLILLLTLMLSGCGLLNTASHLIPTQAGTDKSIAKNAHLGIGKNVNQSQSNHASASLSNAHTYKSEHDTIVLNERLPWWLFIIICLLVPSPVDIIERGLKRYFNREKKK